MSSTFIIAARVYCISGGVLAIGAVLAYIIQTVRRRFLDIPGKIEMRRRMIRSDVYYMVLCVSAGVILLLAIWKKWAGEDDGLESMMRLSMFAFMFPVACCQLLIRAIDKELRACSMAYRKAVIMNTLHPRYYEPDEYIPKKALKGLGLYKGWWQCKGSDLVGCEYRGVKLVFADMHLTHMGRRTEITDFKGTCILLESDYTLNPMLRIKEEKKILNEQIEAWEKGRVDKVHIEYDDDTKRRTDFTPGLVRNLLKAVKTADERIQVDSSVVIVQNFICVMLPHNKDLFEFADSTSMEEYRSRCQRELTSILCYIDILIDRTPLFDQSRSGEMGNAVKS